MFVISCPWCGERDHHEFTCHGEAHIARPETPENLSDQEWADYVFFRTNPKGGHWDRWEHSAGCRRWFYMYRDTVSDTIHATYPVGENRPT
ncbi:MAG: sarcosine oxidase subunit delta [Pseudomonadota bacterium]